MHSKRLSLFVVLATLFSWPAWAAENFQILDQRLDASRQGYTVIRVWGTHREMGRAIGSAFAQDLIVGVEDVKNKSGNWASIRSAVDAGAWPPEILEEIDGIVEGVKAASPTATLDATDIKAVNTFGDWGYPPACRSTSAWGSRVKAPDKTVSTRRLDLDTPFKLALQHVVVAFEPSDGSPRWVNFAWPGYVTVITGLNEYGTLASLHDYNSSFRAGAGVTFRSLAAREILTEVGKRPIAEHRTWAQSLLAQEKMATGSFINYFVPEGNGAVFTCTTGGNCGAMRTPQPSYLGGEALLTTNSQTNGTSVPEGGEFMDSYYRSTSTADIASQWSIFGMSGLHLVSVAYRNPEDMTIWMNGRGRTDRLELEWKDLFSSRETPVPAGDAGTPERNAGTGAGAPAGDPVTDSGTGLPRDPPAPGTGSDAAAVSRDASVLGCSSAGGVLAFSGVVPLLALSLLRRRRRA